MLNIRKVSLITLLFFVISLFSGTVLHKDVLAENGVQASAISGFKAVAAKGNFTLAIDHDNVLWGWGDNTFGQLGDGSKESKNYPKMIMKNVQQVSVGMSHSVAVKKDGSLWAWGNNAYGQLGDGTVEESLKPKKVLDEINMVACGDYHTIAASKDTYVYTWGRNDTFQLGNNSKTNSSLPIKLSLVRNAVSLSGGRGHTLVADSTGKLLAWGLNDKGQLACGDTINRYNPNNEFIKINDIKMVAAGDSHSLLLKNDGSLYASGNNCNYQVGTPLRPSANTVGEISPQLIMTGVKSISAGGFTSYAIKEDGSLWAWGDNMFGQLGNQSTKYTFTPQKLADRVIAVAGGKNHGVFITEDGSIYTAGLNDFGQYGNGETSKPPTDVLSPKRVFGFEDVKGIYTGIDHSALIDNQDKLWVWGKNYYGEVGNGINTLSKAVSLEDVKYAAAGFAGVHAVKNDNSLWSWGHNGFQQIGNGSNKNSNIPIEVLQNVKKVESGFCSTYAITTGNKLYSWGNNDHGQLGNGTKVSSATPVLIMENIIDVAGNKNHALFLKSDGTLLAAGNNSVGQLGVPGYNGLSPITVPGLSNIIDVGCGEQTSYALSQDGSLWAWGHNKDGKLGDGTSNNRTSPVKIMDNVVSFRIGYYQGFAITENGDLYGWGTNTSGQLGIGNKKNQSNPTKIMAGVSMVSSALDHTLAVKSDGSVWAWGKNGNNELGIFVPKSPQKLNFRKYVLSKTKNFLKINASGYLEAPFDPTEEFKPTWELVNVTSEGLIQLNADGKFTTGNIQGQAQIRLRNANGDVVYGNYEVDIGPVYMGVVDGMAYNTPRTVQILNGTAKLNGVAYQSGSVISAEGRYELKIVDINGDVTVVNFFIDKTPPVIEGVKNGEVYQSPREIIIEEGATATLNGEPFSGGLVSQEGVHKLVASDHLGNTINIEFEINIPIIVTGVEKGEIYNKPVTINFNIGNATLNGKEIQSGHVVEEDGNYKLVITKDYKGETKEINFTIDSSVLISGVTDGAVYDNERTIEFDEGVTVLLNGSEIESGFVVGEGLHQLEVTGKLGNTAIYKFEINIPIVIEGVKDGVYYNHSVVVTYNVGDALLNGQSIESGTEVSEEGEYLLTVSKEDDRGSKRITFVIDMTPPEVMGIENGQVYQTEKFLEVNDENLESLLLNGEQVDLGIVIGEGLHTLLAIDKAGNQTEISFDINIPINIEGVEDGKHYRKKVQLIFDQGKATLNNQKVESGVFVTDDGIYQLVVVKDNDRGQTVINFVIDKTKPVIIARRKNGKLVNSGTILKANVFIEVRDDNAVTHTFKINKELTDWPEDGKLSKDGLYNLVVQDLAGNKATFKCNIDKLKPVIKVTTIKGKKKVKHKATVKRNVKIKIVERNIKKKELLKNGKKIKWTKKIKSKGKYLVRVRDKVNRVTKFRFRRK